MIFHHAVLKIKELFFDGQESEYANHIRFKNDLTFFNHIFNFGQRTICMNDDELILRKICGCLIFCKRQLDMQNRLGITRITIAFQANCVQCQNGRILLQHGGLIVYNQLHPSGKSFFLLTLYGFHNDIFHFFRDKQCVRCYRIRFLGRRFCSIGRQISNRRNVDMCKTRITANRTNSQRNAIGGHILIAAVPLSFVAADRAFRHMRTIALSCITAISMTGGRRNFSQLETAGAAHRKRFTLRFTGGSCIRNQLILMPCRRYDTRNFFPASRALNHALAIHSTLGSRIGNSFIYMLCNGQHFGGLFAAVGAGCYLFTFFPTCRGRLDGIIFMTNCRNYFGLFIAAIGAGHNLLAVFLARRGRLGSSILMRQSGNFLSFDFAALTGINNFSRYTAGSLYPAAFHKDAFSVQNFFLRCTAATSIYYLALVALSLCKFMLPLKGRLITLNADEPMVRFVVLIGGISIAIVHHFYIIAYFHATLDTYARIFTGRTVLICLKFHATASTVAPVIFVVAFIGSIRIGVMFDFSVVLNTTDIAFARIDTQGIMATVIPRFSASVANVPVFFRIGMDCAILPVMSRFTAAIRSAAVYTCIRRSAGYGMSPFISNFITVFVPALHPAIGIIVYAGIVIEVMLHHCVISNGRAAAIACIRIITVNKVLALFNFFAAIGAEIPAVRFIMGQRILQRHMLTFTIPVCTAAVAITGRIAGSFMHEF